MSETIQILSAWRGNSERTLVGVRPVTTAKADPAARMRSSKASNPSGTARVR